MGSDDGRAERGGFGIRDRGACDDVLERGMELVALGLGSELRSDARRGRVLDRGGDGPLGTEDSPRDACDTRAPAARTLLSGD